MAGLCAGLMVVSAQAAFQVVEDFDSLTLGDINGQNGWVASLNSNGVELDPAGGSNQVLKVFTESGTLHKAASVVQGTTRMLFLRLRFEEHGRYSFGLSFASNPTEYIDFQPELGMAAATNSDPGNDLRVAAVNNSALEVLGYRLHEVLGRPVKEVFKVDHSRITVRDDLYWATHNALPKAFVAASVMRDFWNAGRGGGWATAIYFGQEPESLLAELSASGLGPQVRDVYAEAMAGAAPLQEISEIDLPPKGP